MFCVKFGIVISTCHHYYVACDITNLGVKQSVMLSIVYCYVVDCLLQAVIFWIWGNMSQTLKATVFFNQTKKLQMDAAALFTQCILQWCSVASSIKFVHLKINNMPQLGGTFKHVEVYLDWYLYAYLFAQRYHLLISLDIYFWYTNKFTSKF